jgi:two-component system, cell cycle sensor histidine kinase and response regulator CckA
MTSTALANRFRAALNDESCCDLNQVIARREPSIAEVLGQTVLVQFALSPNALRVAVPFLEVERIVVGLCGAALGLIGSSGRIVIETRGVNDAQLSPLLPGATAQDGLARIIVRTEQFTPAQPSPQAMKVGQTVSSTRHPALGFSAIEALLERLGGRLEFVPLPHDEVAYVAHLPYARAPDSSGRMPVAHAEHAGVILLVEDEPQVQAVTARILRTYGYQVITAHNERTALAQAEQCGGSIGLVVSDLVLPGVSGKDLVKRLRQPCEHARVLFISGYSPEHVGALSEDARFLRKPFTAQELLAVVAQLLPESRPR